MSRNEWERGTWKLPAKEYTRVRRLIMDAANAHADRLYRTAYLLHKEIVVPAGSPTDPSAIRELISGSERWRRLAAAEQLQFENLYVIVQSMTDGQPKVPHFADVRATSRTKLFRSGECFLSFADAGKVVWEVEEGNHARDEARDSWLGRAFFTALGTVQWTSRTGGTVVGNDEYNEGSREEGGGANYVIARYGADETAFKRTLNPRRYQPPRGRMVKKNTAKTPTRPRRPYSKKTPAWMRVIDAWSTLSQPVRGAMCDEWVDGSHLVHEAFGFELSDWMLEMGSESRGLETDFRKEQPNASMAAFGYLFRRFGAPMPAGDEYKRMAVYYLGTPMDDLALCISSGGGSLTLDVSYLIGYSLMERMNEAYERKRAVWSKRFAKFSGTADPAKQMELMLDADYLANAAKQIGAYPREPIDWHEGSLVRRQVNRALLAALRELLRPVYIRDVPLNILGKNPTIYDQADEG